MLTFFRKIRKGLLGSGRARKYFLFALGEIALVVIGILIALQINNWNEWRKDRVKEESVLIDLQENLLINIDLLTTNIAMHEDHNNSADLIIHAITNGLPYSDSLNSHFHKSRIQTGGSQYLSHTGYESLRDAGLDIIINKDLKDNILYLYEVTYSSNIESLEWFDQIDPFREKSLYENFIDAGYGTLAPVNYALLLNDQYYISMIIALRGHRIYWNKLLGECLRETQRVLQLIKEELQSTD